MVALEDLIHLVVVFQCNLAGFGAETLAVESAHHHIVGAGPYSSLPVSAVRAVFRTFSLYAGHHPRPAELCGVLQVSHQLPLLCRIQQAVRQQRPIGTDGLHAGKGAVGILVVKEARGLVPEIFANIRGQTDGFVLHMFDFLPTFDVESHLQHLVVDEYLLEVRVEPYHVAMAEVEVVAFRQTGDVVHTGSPARRPIRAVAPRTVQPEPVVVAYQHGENLVQALHIAELPVVFHLAPWYEVRSGGDGVVAFEAVRTVAFDFAADETVGMLFGVEIVERQLEGEEAGAVLGEHQDEGAVPHEDVPVVRRVEIGCHESASRLGIADVSHTDFPCPPVHLQFPVVSLPQGFGQNLACLLEGGDVHAAGLHGTERILRHVGIAHIGILVGQLVDAVVAAGGLGCGGHALHGKPQRKYGKEFHFVRSCWIFSFTSPCVYTPSKRLAPGP